MSHLIPIRIKVTRGAGKQGQGQMIYPPFGDLPPEVRGHMDWSAYIDAHGFGMHYDQVSGFGIADDYNPDPNAQYCATLVPEEFAIASAARWPDLVALLTEDDFEHFHDNRARVHDDEILDDLPVLQAIHYKHQLREAGLLPQPDEAEKLKIANALDPNHPARGIRKNPARYYRSKREAGKITISLAYRSKRK